MKPAAAEKVQRQILFVSRDRINGKNRRPAEDTIRNIPLYF